MISAGGGEKKKTEKKKEEERGQRGGTCPQDELIWESLGTHAP